MKLAIVGSRSFNNYELLNNYARAMFNSATTIVSGGASVADKLAARYAKEFNLELIEHLPDWNKHGMAAGPIRNELIVKDCDMILAFWDGVSKGTASTLSIGKRLKKPTFVVYI